MTDADTSSRPVRTSNRQLVEVALLVAQVAEQGVRANPEADARPEGDGIRGQADHQQLSPYPQ